MSQWGLLSIQIVAMAVILIGTIRQIRSHMRTSRAQDRALAYFRSLRIGADEDQAGCPDSGTTTGEGSPATPRARDRRERAVADTFDPFTTTWELPGRVMEELEEVQEQAAENLRKATELSSELADTERRLGIAVEDERDPADRATEGRAVSGLVRKLLTEIVSVIEDSSKNCVCASEDFKGLILDSEDVLHGQDYVQRRGQQVPVVVLGVAEDLEVGLGHLTEVPGDLELLVGNGLKLPSKVCKLRVDAALILGLLSHGSSSVGGDGAMDGGPAPSPVDGSTDPTEEAQSSEAASADEGVA